MSSSVDEPSGESGEVVRYESASVSLWGTTDPAEIVVKATKVANALRDIIKEQKLFTLIQGKAHVNVGGWQLLGSLVGVTAVCTETVEVENGWKATVEARASDGRVIGSADALCTSDEKRGPWKKADRYALCSMAQTRATSKALKGPLGFVVSLAGYEATPAEEMTFADADAVSEAVVVDVVPTELRLETEVSHLQREMTAAKAHDPALTGKLKAFIFTEFGARSSQELDAEQVRATRVHLASLSAQGSA
jgi:hypothetical protein